MFDEVSDRRLRALAGRALVAGLCVAGSVAIVTLLSGSFEDTHWRVIATSLGFSVFSCTAAAGAGLRLTHVRWAQLLGTVTVVSSALAWALLAAGLWIAGDDPELLWRAFGVALVTALWSAHAALVLRARRATDTDAVRRLGALSIVTLGIDALACVIALVGAVDRVDETWGRIGGALLVVTLLSTALVPILRRQQRRAAARPATLAVEVAEVAQRLSRMDLPPQAYAEVARLRELARAADE